MQLARLAVYPPGDAREDWTIIRALSETLGKKLPYDALRQLRSRMVEINTNFLNVDKTTPAQWQPFGADGELGSEPFDTAIDNFYMTDPISRASETMAHCTESFVRVAQGKTGTDG